MRLIVICAPNTEAAKTRHCAINHNTDSWIVWLFMKKDIKAIKMAASKEPAAQKYSTFSLAVIVTHHLKFRPGGHHKLRGLR